MALNNAADVQGCENYEESDDEVFLEDIDMRLTDHRSNSILFKQASLKDKNKENQLN